MIYPPPTMKIPVPPAYLDENLSARFSELAPAAVRNGTLTNSTADAFTRYVIAEQEYLKAVQRVLNALRIGDMSGAAQWSQVQDRFFRELQAGGRTFGLTPDGDLF